MLVAIQQARHGEGDVQHVLGIVVLDIAGPEAGKLTRIVGGEIPEQNLQGREVEAGIPAFQNSAHLGLNGDGIGHVHRIADIHMSRAIRLRQLHCMVSPRSSP